MFIRSATAVSFVLAAIQAVTAAPNAAQKDNEVKCCKPLAKLRMNAGLPIDNFGIRDTLEMPHLHKRQITAAGGADDFDFLAKYARAFEFCRIDKCQCYESVEGDIICFTEPTEYAIDYGSVVFDGTSISVTPVTETASITEYIVDSTSAVVETETDFETVTASPTDAASTSEDIVTEDITETATAIETAAAADPTAIDTQETVTDTATITAANAATQTAFLGRRDAVVGIFPRDTTALPTTTTVSPYSEVSEMSSLAYSDRSPTNFLGKIVELMELARGGDGYGVEAAGDASFKLDKQLIAKAGPLIAQQRQLMGRDDNLKKKLQKLFLFPPDRNQIVFRRQYMMIDENGQETARAPFEDVLKTFPAPWKRDFNRLNPPARNALKHFARRVGLVYEKDVDPAPVQVIENQPILGSLEIAYDMFWYYLMNEFNVHPLINNAWPNLFDMFVKQEPVSRITSEFPSTYTAVPDDVETDTVILTVTAADLRRRQVEAVPTLAPEPIPSQIPINAEPELQPASKDVMDLANGVVKAMNLLAAQYAEDEEFRQLQEDLRFYVSYLSTALGQPPQDDSVFDLTYDPVELRRFTLAVARLAVLLHFGPEEQPFIPQEEWPKLPAANPSSTQLRAFSKSIELLVDSVAAAEESRSEIARVQSVKEEHEQASSYNLIDRKNLARFPEIVAHKRKHVGKPFTNYNFDEEHLQPEIVVDGNAYFFNRQISKHSDEGSTGVHVPKVDEGVRFREKEMYTHSMKRKKGANSESN